MKFVSVVATRLGEQVVHDLFAALNMAGVDDLEIKRAFYPRLEGKAEKVRPVVHALARFERRGFELTRQETDESVVFTIRPWCGMGVRRLMSGGVQLRRDGRLYNYGSMGEMRADSPMFEDMTFDNWMQKRIKS